jgi:hypothetical protein
MADSGNYFANPRGISTGMAALRQLADFANGLVTDFNIGVEETKGWTGENDSLANQLKPADQNDIKQSLNTARSLTSAVVGVAQGTETNLKSILSTQQDSLDAIHQAAVPPADFGGDDVDTGGHAHH